MNLTPPNQEKTLEKRARNQENPRTKMARWRVMRAAHWIYIYIYIHLHMYIYTSIWCSKLAKPLHRCRKSAAQAAGNMPSCRFDPERSETTPKLDSEPPGRSEMLGKAAVQNTVRRCKQIDKLINKTQTNGLQDVDCQGLFSFFWLLQFCT